MANKKDIANELMGGTRLPYDYKFTAGIGGSQRTGEIIKPLNNGKYYRRPMYLQTGEFRTFGELRRSAWDS